MPSGSLEWSSLENLKCGSETFCRCFRHAFFVRPQGYRRGCVGGWAMMSGLAVAWSPLFWRPPLSPPASPHRTTGKSEAAVQVWGGPVAPGALRTTCPCPCP